MSSLEARYSSIKKSDAALQVVWAEVYAPGVIDSHNHFMKEDDIRDMMFRFMKAQRLAKIDVRHSQTESGCAVVECFQARKGDPDFIEGSWVMGVWCPDHVWAEVQSGDLNGFSIDVEAILTTKKMEMHLPDLMTGDTTLCAGHYHKFEASFDENGRFAGGVTSPAGPDNHVHRIIKGTATEMTGGHNHRFSVVEGLMEYAQG